MVRKACCLCLLLSVLAAISVAQTASRTTYDGADPYNLGRGTAALENRILGESAAPAPFEFPNLPGDASPEPAGNLGRLGAPLFSTAQRTHYNLLVEDSVPRNATAGPPSAEDSVSTSRSRAPADFAVKPVEPPRTDTKIHWTAANGEALLATGIDHIFNLWTEAGTRDALYGPWAKNWLQSVSELRGWSDSDQFMAPYVGHTIQGSIYGYILRQNDPKYRDVQWGDGREYYMSLLRSMGFSAVWHTQWKIGPISEDSIGNVMLHASPGFICLVVTPTLGTVDMLGEDALDRYLLMGLENRTANGPLIVFARSFLNPGRSFANVMAFKLPWYRSTRIGLFGENHLIRKQLVYDYKHNGGPKPFEFVKRQPATSDSEPGHIFPKVAAIELSAYPNFERFSDGRNCIGGGGSGAVRLSPSWQIGSEVNGCLIMGFSKYTQSADSLFYGAGPRWTPLAAHRWSPYAELLLGGRKVTYEVDNPELETKLLDAWNDGSGTLAHYPKRSDWSTQVASNGLSLAAGGGLDVVVTRPFTWRLVNVQYTHSWMGGVDTVHPQNGMRISTEAVLRIGTW